MLLPHVGIASHDLWLDLVMKERRGSICHERIAPSLSPLSHHLPHCVWLIHSCIYFLFLLPLFQRGSPYFKPVFVNPYWSAVANTLYCALERIDWSWTLFLSSNKIVIRSNFVALYVFSMIISTKNNEVKIAVCNIRNAEIGGGLPIYRQQWLFTYIKLLPA